MGMREEEFEAWLLDYTDGEGAPGTMRVVMKHAWQAATLQAAERMKEEAAKIEKVLAKSPAFFAKWSEWEAYKKGVAEYRNEIRAIDVNKLFGE